MGLTSTPQSALLFLGVLGFAAACSALATPVFAAVARRLGLVVHPRTDRWHGRSTPLLGGAAIVLGLAATVVALAPASREMAAVVVGAAAAFALGLADDVRHLAPSTKLAAQFIIGAWLYFAGVRVELVSLPPISFLLTVAWVVILMNSVNLIDNMDGLAAGVTFIAGTVLGVMALSTSTVASLLAAATAGASLGFLIHNFPPARVFMGDAGSQLLGFMLASTALVHTIYSASSVAVTLLAPIAVLALPIFDTALVTLARQHAGRPVSQGGRDHSSHRLASLGYSDRTVVVLLYGIASLLAGVGLLSTVLGLAAVPVFMISGVALVLFGVFLGEIEVYGAAPRRGAPAILDVLWPTVRFGFQVGLDTVLLTLALLCAFMLRYEDVSPSGWLGDFGRSVALFVASQVAVIALMGGYKMLWRYFGITDARNLAVGAAGGATLGAALAAAFATSAGLSAAVVVMDALLAFSLLVGSRNFVQWVRSELGSRALGRRRVLVVGASELGLAAVRALERSPAERIKVVGFIDDDPGRRGRRLAGVPVIGTTRELSKVLESVKPDVVLIALTDEREARTRVESECRDREVPTKTLLDLV